MFKLEGVPAQLQLPLESNMIELVVLVIMLPSLLLYGFNF